MILINLANKSSNIAILRYALKPGAVRNQFSTANQNRYDIVIAGGGMVGITLACTLGKNAKLSNKRILLLEAGEEKTWSQPEKYSNRVVLLNPGTYNLLNNIGAWKQIEKSRYAIVKKLQVWDGISDASVTFGDETLSENISYVVENDLLLAAVSTEIKEIANVDVIYNAKVKDYHLPEYHENVVEIDVEGGTKYTCDLLIISKDGDSGATDVTAVGKALIR